MKFIHKAFAFILPVAMTMGAASCSDFIDIDPENTLDVEAVDYSQTANMYQPVVGAYSDVRSQAMHWANKMLISSRDGDMWSGRTDDQGTAVDFGRYFNYSNGFWALNNVWNTYYNLIRTCNSSLDALDNYASYLTAGSSDYSNYLQYCGEVRTIRAFAYYMLVTNFGPIPLYKENTQSDFQRSTVEHVYEYMIEELTWAINNMQRMRPNQMSHMGALTAYSAELLAAKVYLLQENWAQAEAMTDDIINNGNFELYSDYYQLFKIPGKLCNESLFECQVTDFGTGSGDQIGVDQWFNFAGPFSIKSADGATSFGGWGFMGYEDSFQQWAANRGETIRIETSFLPAGSTTREGWVISDARGTSTNCWNGKDYLPYDQLTTGRTGYGTNNNVRVWRYAEALLINAEAKVRQGRSGDAPLNQVRSRAQMPAINGATLQDVLDERRMELCSEWGNRYVDLVRTGQAAAVLGNQGWNESKTYWPIPQGQLDNNSDLLLDPK